MGENRGLLSFKNPLDVSTLDAMWESLVLAIIGETIESSSIVNGCKVVDKSGKGRVLYKLEVYLNVAGESNPQVVAVRKDLARILQEASASGAGRKGLTKDIKIDWRGMDQYGPT